MADTLIRTKLRLPITRPGLVSRPRLQEQIQQGLCGPLTLVTAPAGFGKTTLVASCVAACGMPVAWLSLDRNDNRAGRFLTYLIAAFQVADQRIGSEAAQLVAGVQQPSSEAVLTSLINDLDTASVEMVMVLDDYQFITSQAVNSELTFFLDHCPRNLHLLIATRSDPPLPIARLRARGQLVELRAADLRFTPAEAGQFMTGVMGLSLDAGAIQTLEDRTEGWIAGLQMAALSMRDREDVDGFIAGFSGTNRFILDYLLEEVLAHQPPETQRFLLCTSILERLTGSLCDALMIYDGRGEAGGEGEGCSAESPSNSQLEYLERENLFLITLDDTCCWFRYHHLFADLLNVRLQQTQPDLIPELHIRASAWFEKNGFIPEAIQHLFAVQAYDRAADLIERYGPARWVESDLSVMQMADSLPYQMLIGRPKIGIHQVWLLINQGRIEKALPLLNDLERELAGEDANPEHQWIKTVIRLALAFLTASSNTQASALLPDLEQVEKIPASEEILRDTADLLYGMTLGRRGEFDRAVEFSVRCLQRAQEPDRATPHKALAIPSLTPFLATIYLFQGRLHAAAALCREYLGPIKKKGIRISTASNLDIVLGEVLYEWNYLEEAERQIRDGVQANEPWRNIMTDAFGLLSLACVCMASGNYAGAMQVVEKFETRLQDDSRPGEFAEDFRTLRARVQLASGDLRSAADWADRVITSEDYHHYPDFYRLTLARIRLAQRRYIEVEEILTAKPTRNLTGNRIARKLETDLHLAASLAGQQRLSEALELVDASLALAEAEEYIRIFLNVGEWVRELLNAYLRTPAPAHKQYAQKLLEAFSSDGKTEPATPRAAGLVEQLSERELEVLQLMALGRTNQEIAQRLVVAQGTVKAHAASIYRKLDVANRTEAVARARQLNILS